MTQKPERQESDQRLRPVALAHWIIFFSTSAYRTYLLRNPILHMIFKKLLDTSPFNGSGQCQRRGLRTLFSVTIFSSISQRSSIDHPQWEDEVTAKRKIPRLDVLNQRWRVTWGRIGNSPFTTFSSGDPYAC